MSYWLLGIIIVLIGVSGLAVARSNAFRRRRALLSERTPVDESVWLTDVCEEDKLTVLKMVDFFACVLGVYQNRLYPSDRFDGALRLKGWFLIDEDVEEEFKECLSDSFKNVLWMDHWTTLGDVVYGVVDQLKSEDILRHKI